MTTKILPTETRIKADIAVFTLLVWGMALLCALTVRGAVDFAALDKSPAWVWGVLILLSWVPAFAALGTQIIRTGSARGFVSGWRWPAFRWLGTALIAPASYATAVTLLTWTSGAGVLDTREFMRAATSSLGSGWASPNVVALCYGALTLVGGTIAFSLFALGEEVGWSGFVIPRLLPLLGVPRTALITGLLWSSYHFPLILLARNYTQGTSIGFTLLGLTVAITGMAFLSVWLRSRSGSIGPMVLLHAGHNVWLFYLYEPLTRELPLTPYVGGEHGVGMMLVAAIIAVSITRSYQQRGFAAPHRERITTSTGEFVADKGMTFETDLDRFRPAHPPGSLPRRTRETFRCRTGSDGGAGSALRD